MQEKQRQQCVDINMATMCVVQRDLCTYRRRTQLPQNVWSSPVDASLFKQHMQNNERQRKAEQMQ